MDCIEIGKQKQNVHDKEIKHHADIDGIMGQDKINYDDDNNDGDFFARYRRADGKEITSNVISDKKPWNNHSFLIPHEPCKLDPFISINQ